MPLFCDTFEIDGNVGGKIQSSITNNAGVFRAIGTVLDSLDVGGASYLSFSTYAGQSQWKEVARATKDGKLGIGIQSPSTVLDVAGPGRFSGGLTVTNVRSAHQVYMLGDSLTAAGRVEWKLNGSLGASWNVRNKGIGGQTTAQMLARLSNDVLQSGDAEYLVVWGGVNDIAGNATSDQIIANLQAIYSQAQADGLKVVAITISPFKGNTAWTTARQAVADAVNAWIATAPVDGRVDTSGLGDGTGALQTAYDSGDHLHLSQAGYDYLAGLLYSATQWAPLPAPAWSINVDVLAVKGVPVVRAQQPAIADATNCVDVVGQLNAALAALRAHGLIAT